MFKAGGQLYKMKEPTEYEHVVEGVSKDAKRGKSKMRTHVKATSYKISIIFQWLLGMVIWALNIVMIVVIVVLRNVSRIIRVFMFFLPHLVGPQIPSKTRGTLRRRLIWAGVNMRVEELISTTILYSIALSVTASILAVVFGLKIHLVILIGVGLFAGIWILMYLGLNVLIYRRTESVENALPDVLDMIGQNMVTGMTTYNSLWVAARPEFGPLALEIQTAAKDTLAGSPLEDALLKVVERVKSDKLERSINLIVQGMRSGGELPAVLAGVSEDMRAERNLKKQMKAETSAYALFIMFTIAIGTPLLFSISLQFMTIFTGLFEATGLDDMSSGMDVVGMSISALSITPAFFMKYILSTIAVIAIYGGLLLGLIRTGNLISGLQIIPVTLFISIVVFLVLNYALGTVFSSLMGF